jgi:CheY-like chemotaxis protein
VRRLVEMHGGSVTAYSEGPGTGSEFVVRLPVHAPESSVPDATADADSEPIRAARQRRILVVDDNVDAAESLALLLQIEGHDVRVAHDGPAALAAVDAEMPDLVFLDIGMPMMNGYDVARRLRERPGLESLVLVAVTGWARRRIGGDRRRQASTTISSSRWTPDALRKLLAVTRGRLPA